MWHDLTLPQAVVITAIIIAAAWVAIVNIMYEDDDDPIN